MIFDSPPSTATSYDNTVQPLASYLSPLWLMFASQSFIMTGNDDFIVVIATAATASNWTVLIRYLNTSCLVLGLPFFQFDS